MQQTGYLPLTISALFCRVLAWFPLWLMVLSVCGVSKMLLPMSILLFTAWLSALCGRFFRLHFHARPRRAALCANSVMLTAAILCGALLISRIHSTAAAVFLIAVTFLPVHIHLDAEPDELFRTGAYATFLSGNVIACALLHLAQFAVPMQFVLSIIGLLSAIYLLLRNQFMLLRLVNRRSAVSAAVPQEIRRGNLMLVGGIIAVFALIFLFRAPLLQVLFWMQDTARRLVGLLLKGIAALVSQLGGDAPEPVPEEAAEFAETMPPPTGKSNPLWLLLWIPVAAVAWYMWRELLSDWFYDFRILAARFIRKLRGIPEDDAPELSQTDAEYTDTETTVRPRESRRRICKNWKRALKEWQKTPATDAKFYAGYRLLLGAPCWKSDELRPADTVRRIQEKWMQGHTPAALLDAVTADFQLDRYAERGLPPEALADMETALNGILAELWKRR